MDDELGTIGHVSKKEYMYFTALNMASWRIEKRLWLLHGKLVPINELTETVLILQFYWLINTSTAVLFKDEWLAIFIKQLNYCN